MRDCMPSVRPSTPTELLVQCPHRHSHTNRTPDSLEDGSPLHSSGSTQRPQNPLPTGIVGQSRREHAPFMRAAAHEVKHSGRTEGGSQRAPPRHCGYGYPAHPSPVPTLLCTIPASESLRLGGELPAPRPPRGSTAHLGYWGLPYGFFQVCFTCECTLRACMPEHKKIAM